MFLTVLEKLGKTVAWIIAIIDIGILLQFMYLAINNRFGESDGAGLGAIIMPLALLLPLAVTLPVVIKTFYHLFADGKTASAVISIFAIIFVYIGFFITIVWNYTLTWRDSLIVPGGLMCIFAIALFAFMLYGLMDARHLGISLFLATLAVSIAVLPSIVSTTQQLAKSKNSMPVSYGEPFDLTSFQEYKFPDFILKPDLQLQDYTYTVVDNNQKIIQLLIDICVHEGQLWTNCKNFTQGYGYEKGDTWEIDSKTYTFKASGDKVIVKVDSK